MSRPPPENIGTAPCPWCGAPAHVRRAKSRKALREGQAAPRQGGFVDALYLYCEAGCGVIQSTGRAAQAKLAAAIGQAPPAPAPAPARPAAAPPAPAPAPAPRPAAPAPAPAPKKSPGLLEW